MRLNGSLFGRFTIGCWFFVFLYSMLLLLFSFCCYVPLLEFFDCDIFIDIIKSLNVFNLIKFLKF